MSFHPRMPYGEGWHKSDRVLPEDGPAFTFTEANRAKFEEIASHYPPEQRKSAILAALYLAQEQQGFVSRQVIRHVADVIGCTAADVEDVVTYYVMFFTRAGRQVRPAGVPDAVVRVERRRARDRGALPAPPRPAGRDGRDGHLHGPGVRMPRRVRSRAGGDGEQRSLARASASRRRPGLRRSPAHEGTGLHLGVPPGEGKVACSA